MKVQRDSDARWRVGDGDVYMVGGIVRKEQTEMSEGVNMNDCVQGLPCERCF